MTTSSDPHDSGLVPTDEAAARRRYERVSGLDPEGLAVLTKEELLLSWWGFFWLHPELHPDDAEVWPDDVSDVRHLASEAFRRYRAGEITDGEYYPTEAVRDRIERARESRSWRLPQPQHQQADTSET